MYTLLLAESYNLIRLFLFCSVYEWNNHNLPVVDHFCIRMARCEFYRGNWNTLETVCIVLIFFFSPSLRTCLANGIPLYISCIKYSLQYIHNGFLWHLIIYLYTGKCIVLLMLKSVFSQGHSFLALNMAEELFCPQKDDKSTNKVLFGSNFLYFHTLITKLPQK